MARPVARLWYAVFLSLLAGAPAVAEDDAGCASDPGNGEIVAVARAARTSGVAPLAVFFDARDTRLQPPARSFHDLEFRWNFGDPGSGTWSSGARPHLASRNIATGGVTAHVFERPGSYLVALAITGDMPGQARQCLRINVYDPNAFFVGDRTTCLSVAGDFNGCPEGARRATSPGADIVAALRDHGGPSRRLLLRRGETWRAREAAVIRWTGPGILGAYGDGPRPRIEASADSDQAILQISGPTTADLRDWRVMDIDFDGKGNSRRTAIKGEGGISQLTLLRLGMERVRNGVLFSSSVLDWHNRTPATGGHPLWDQLAAVDSATTGIVGTSGAYSVYASASRLMLLGNAFDNGGGGEHTVRLPSVVAGVVSNNSFRGQGQAAGGKHAFTLRAAVHGSGGVEGGRDTQWVVVSDNAFHGAAGSDWTVTYQPQASADERVVDVVTERNRFFAGPGTQFGLVLFARRQTVRNNLFDLTGSRAHGGILVHDGLTVGSRDVAIHHNSFRADDAGRGVVAIQVRPAAEAVVVTNNLAYAPRHAQNRLLTGPATAAANSSDAQIQTVDPRFSERSPGAPGSWTPLAGSYAVGNGVAAPVWSDFNASPRPATPRHLGAVLP